jgi:ketosteroid isomerase-like protein
MSQENIEIVRRGYAAWNRGDMDAMLAVLHPDLEYVASGLFPGLAPAYRGHAGWRDFWRDFRGTWDSLRVEMEDARDIDDRVVALLTFHARSREGLEIERPFANIWTFENGLATRLHAHGDWAEALQIAGLSK